MTCTNGKIQVITASYGKNCKSTNLNNQLNNLKSACDNKQKCQYKIDHLKIGDAAPNCPKTYVYKYKCGSNSSYKLPNMNVNAMNKLHVTKHRNTLKKHLSNIQNSILNEMQQSFKENNEQTKLLQQIDDSKQRQTELDLQHKILEIKKAERRELNKDKNLIMKQEINYENQARKDRQKLMTQKQKYLKQEHNMKVKEHKALMNGLKEFINNCSQLIAQKQQTQLTPKKYDIGKVPMPPLPAHMKHHMKYVRRLNEINEVNKICKCLNGEFGEICVSYNYEKDIVGFDVMISENGKMEQNNYNEMKRYNVYEYVFEMDGISECDLIVGMVGVCYKKDNVMVYFDNGENNIFWMHWMDESLWDEVIQDVLEKRIIKCVAIDLMETKLCVGRDEKNDMFFIQLKVLIG